MTSLQLTAQRSSTQSVASHERIDFWEAHSAAHLIGLRCSTHDPEGLQASSLHYDLGLVQLTDIRGNQHVIERPRHMLSTHPKDAIFACLLLEGSAFFFQHDACTLLQPGDLMVYSTAEAYLYGFTSQMRQIIVECDAAQLLGQGREGCEGLLPRAIHVERAGGKAWPWVIAWKAAVLDFVNAPLRSKADALAQRCLSGLQMLVNGGSAAAGGTDAWRLLQAQSYILDNLARPELDMTEVARAQAISVRHLHRLFAAGDVSPADWMWQQRIARAQRALDGLGARSTVSLSDLAYGLGFSNPSHFSRLFRKQLQLSPTQYRQQQNAK